MDGVKIIRPVWPYKMPERFARFIRDHNVTTSEIRNERSNLERRSVTTFTVNGIDKKTSSASSMSISFDPNDTDMLDALDNSVRMITLNPAALKILSQMDEFDRLFNNPAFATRKGVWLIERTFDGLTQYYVNQSPGGEYYWTHKAAEATRFNTIEDAKKRAEFVKLTSSGGIVPVEYVPIFDRDKSSKPKPMFKRGDRVRKVKGGSWQGFIVGEYSTKLTPEGYAVESEREPGSVQIYPAAALEMVK